MSVPGVSRRLAELIEASFPDKTRQRRSAREQDEMTKSEAGWSAGMMISPNMWGNRVYSRVHDGAVPTENYRVLTPPAHTQLEDNPGLPSPYTRSPADSLTLPARSPLASPAGQAGQSYGDDSALSPIQPTSRSHDSGRPLTPSEYDNHLLANGTAGLPGPEASTSNPIHHSPIGDSPEPPPESLTHDSSSSAHDASAALQHQQLPDAQPPKLGSPAHRLTSARHRPYSGHVRPDSLPSEPNLLISPVLPRSGSSADIPGFMRSTLNRLAAASEQLGSVLSEPRGQPNGRYTASSAPAAASSAPAAGRSSTVASRSEATVGHSLQRALRTEDNKLMELWIAQLRRPAVAALGASLPESFGALAPAITSFAQTVPSPRSLPFTMGVQRHSPARLSRSSQGMVTFAAMNPPRFRNRRHSRRRRSSR
ncbi:TPA: hypothetical protein ACH3X1_010408 [Trebouxia sp. C0004]